MLNYRRSQALVPAVPNTMNSAICLSKLGRIVEALELYEQLLTGLGAELNDGQREAIQTAVRELQPRVSWLVVRPNVPATLLVDGTKIGTLPLPSPHRLAPGRHFVRLEAEGYEPFQQQVTAVASETITLNVPLHRTKAGSLAPPPESTLSTSSPASPRPGPSPALDSAPSFGVSPWAIVGFGVAGAGVVAGSITGGISLSQTGNLEEECPDYRCAPEEQETIDSATVLGHASTVCFVVAGVGAALGVVALFVGGGDDETVTASTLRLRIGPGFAGLEGEF